MTALKPIDCQSDLSVTVHNDTHRNVNGWNFMEKNVARCVMMQYFYNYLWFNNYSIIIELK